MRSGRTFALDQYIATIVSSIKNVDMGVDSKIDASGLSKDESSCVRELMYQGDPCAASGILFSTEPGFYFCG